MEHKWLKNKRGQTNGAITGIVIGIAALIIAVIIALTVISTINSADLLSSSRETSTTYNEGLTTLAFCNQTGYTLVGENSTNQAFTIAAIKNATTNTAGIYNFTISTANCSVSANGLVRNTTTLTWNNISINYTYTSMTPEELATNNSINNVTAGIDNVSAKIPTVLLILAIVLILGILAVLIVVWNKMRMGGTTI